MGVLLADTFGLITGRFDHQNEFADVAKKAIIKHKETRIFIKKYDGKL